jgi:hypothetical protein
MHQMPDNLPATARRDLTPQMGEMACRDIENPEKPSEGLISDLADRNSEALTEQQPAHAAMSHKRNNLA